jgi:hypothetical protein
MVPPHKQTKDKDMKHIDNLAAAYAKAVYHNPQGVVFDNIKTAVERVPLYAAAPELLEQCQRMLNIASGNARVRETYAAAFEETRAIIKKAGLPPRNT